MDNFFSFVGQENEIRTNEYTIFSIYKKKSFNK